MTGTARFLRYAAFVMMALFGLLGGLFVAGYAFADLALGTAIGSIALWVVPMVAMSIFAVRRPERSIPVFQGLTAAFALFAFLDTGFGIIPRDDWGPVTTVGLLALAVALGFLGLHRPGMAGLLLVVLSLAQLAGLVVGAAGHGGSAWFGGSSGVVVLPLLVIGSLFLISGALDHEPLRTGHRMRPAH